MLRFSRPGSHGTKSEAEAVSTKMVRFQANLLYNCLLKLGSPIEESIGLESSHDDRFLGKVPHYQSWILPTNLAKREWGRLIGCFRMAKQSKFPLF